jgi:2-dehydropantoate 2-reductase
MKTLIVGAGIIGTIYGWAFAQAGHEVTHLVRPGKAGNFIGGFKIDMYDVRKGHKRNFIGHYPIRVTESVQPADGYELVIVPIKHYRLVETLAQLVPQTGEANYWLLTQNWDGVERINEILPPASYVFGDAKAGGAFEGQTLIATLASVDIGQVAGMHTACLDKVMAICQSAQIPATVHENILHYLWVQYAITGGLWPSLVQGGSFEAVFNNSQLRNQAVLAARESLQVVSQRGVDLKKHPETKMYIDSGPVGMWFAGLAIKFMFRFNKVVQRSSQHALDDAEEIRTFYYDLLHSGQQLGVSMPALSAFEDCIQGMA